MTNAAAAVESLLPAGTQIKYDRLIISGATVDCWKRTKLDPPAGGPSLTLRSRTLRIDLPTKPHESPDALKAAHRSADFQANSRSSRDLRPATPLHPPPRRIPLLLRYYEMCQQDRSCLASPSPHALHTRTPSPYAGIVLRIARRPNAV